MNPMEVCTTNNLLYVKLGIIMELKKRGAVSVDEFERLVAEEFRKVCPDTQGEIESYLFYFLDVVDINGEKVVLSRDGEHYVEVIERLQGSS